MATAYLLTQCQAATPTPQRQARYQALSAVLQHLGFTVKALGREPDSAERALNLETQLGIKNGYLATLSERVLMGLEYQPGDLILATEAEHANVFNGLLEGTGGKVKDTPVLELWNDYGSGYARWRAYSSYSALAFAAGSFGRCEPEWCVLPPYVPVAKAAGSLDVFETRTLLGTDFLFAMAQGCPVVAPDQGAPGELVQHGLTGILYRSPAGQAAAQEAAQLLPSAPIKAWVAQSFPLQAAAEHLQPLIQRAFRG